MRNSTTRIPLLILLGGAIISLLPLLALAMYAFPSADDYCLAVDVRKGFWRMQSDFYLSWTGRYSGIFLQAVLGQWDLARVYPWFCGATLVATVLSCGALIGTVGTSRASRLQITAAGAVATAVFVGGLPSTVEAFYWLTSAAEYQWGVITYFVWFTLLLRTVKDAGRREPSVGLRASLVVLTALLPGFSEVMAPVILVTLAGFLAVSRWRNDGDRFVLILLGVAICFTAVSLLAPGNENRSGTYPDIPTRHNPMYAVTETARQAVRFIGRCSSYPALWVAACAAWWWAPGVVRRAIAGMGGYKWSAAWTLGLLFVLYLTLFPVYWEYGEVNYTGEGRTYNVTYLVFCVTVAFVVGTVLSKASERLPELGARLRARRATVDLILAGALALLMIGSPATLQAFGALKLAPRYLRAQQARESILRSSENAGQAVVVNEMRIRPQGLFWGDIDREETHWANTCVAAYYGLRTVRSPK